MTWVAVGVGVAGLASSVIGGIKSGKAAKRMRQMSKEVPVRERSKYPDQMIQQAQAELNANPFVSVQNRQIASNQANMMAGAERNVVDPTQLLSLVSAYGSQASQDAFKNNQFNQQMRLQKLQDLYNAQRAGQQEDQAVYEGAQTGFNSKANILNAADQTVVNAWQKTGNTLLSAANLYDTAKRG